MKVTLSRSDAWALLRSLVAQLEVELDPEDATDTGAVVLHLPDLTSTAPEG